MKCRHGARLQAARARRGRLEDHRHGRVGDVAVQFRRDVELEDVTAEKDAVPRHAVNDLVVDADQGDPGKTVHHSRRRARAVGVQRASADSIEIGCRQTGPRGGLHRTQGRGDSAARAPYSFAILF